MSQGRIQVLAEERGKEVQRELQTTFLGFVKIAISQLRFLDNGLPNRRKVNRLREIFELEGCRHFDPDYAIKAVIESKTFLESLEQRGLTREELRDQPYDQRPVLRFPDGSIVTCLFGRHRVLAAQQVLPVEDQWWVIHLHSKS